MASLTTSFSDAEMRRLPKPILRRLRAMIRRVRRVTLIKGLFAVLTTALMCLLGIMVIDASVTIFSQQLRWGLSLGGLAIVLLASWWWILRPLSQRISLTRMARMVEERHPELEETVSSAVQLLASDDPEEIRGSEVLIEEVVKSAVDDVKSVSPRREIDGKPIRPWMMAALVFLSLLGLLGALWPKPTMVLLVRAVAPFLEVGNAYADTLKVSPGDAKVPVGSDLTIEVSIKHPRLKRASLRRLNEEGNAEGVERMNLVEVGEDGVRTFSLTLPAIQEDFSYRVHAGSALSRYFEVRLAEPPRINELRVEYDYPDYTGLETREELLEGPEITALAHTRLRLRALLNESVSEAHLIFNGNEEKAMPAAELGDKEAVWSFKVRPRMDEPVEIRLRDSDGFNNEGESRIVRAYADEPPEVRLVSPEARELRLRPTEYLPIRYEAEEDFGFSRSELLVRISGRNAPVVVPCELPLSLGAGGWEGQAGLSLAELELDRVSRLTVQLRLADSLPVDLGGAQEALSEVITIRLEKYAKPLIEQVLESQEREILQELERARQDLNQARSRGQEAAREFERDDTVDGLAKLDQARREMVEAQERLETTAAKMETSVFRERALEMREIAEAPIQKARELSETAPLTENAEERKSQLNEMGEQVEEALVQIEAVKERMKGSEDDVERLAELAQLAQEQSRLAQEARQEMLREESAKALSERGGEEKTESQREALRDAAAEALKNWAREQQELQKDLAELLRQDPKALQEALSAQAEEAGAMAQEAEQLRREQEELARMAESSSREEAARMHEELRRELLSALREEQEEISEEARDLRQELRQKYPEAADAHEQLSSASDEARKAARGMTKSDLTPSMEAADRAREQLQEAASEAQEELAKEGIRQQTEQALEDAMAAAGKLSEPVREAMENLAREVAEQMVESSSPDGEPISMEQRVGEAVKAMQEAVAEAGAEAKEAMAENGDPTAAEGEALAQALAEKGQELLREWSPPPASDAGSEGPPAPIPADPEAARDLQALAARQEAVTEALDALERGQLSEAMAARQEQLSREAAALAQEAQALEQSASLTQQNQAKSKADQAERQFETARQQAEAAAGQLERAQQEQDKSQAQQAMESAGESLSQEQAMAQAQQGQVAPQPASSGEQAAMKQSQQAQQRTEAALGSAAEQLSQAQEALTKQAGDLSQKSPPESASPLMESEELAESFEQVSQAARASDAAEAAQQSSEAAQNLQQMAREAAEQMGALGEWADAMTPGSSPQQQSRPARSEERAGEAGADGMSQFGNPQGETRGDGVPPEMAKLGISVEDWARLKGNVRSDLTNEQRASTPQEYRGMVGDYFRIIAEEAKKE